MRHDLARVLVISGIAGMTASCTGETDRSLTASEAEAVVETYAAILHAAYSDAIQGAETLDAALVDFIASPDEARLTRARQRWVESRPAYLQTEVARFYDGPIDDPDNGPEPRINAWPLDEAFIDYVESPSGRIWGGLVNDPSILPTISADALSEQNQRDSEQNVATGYHAIEFLLWGQDLSSTGPGARPAIDYVEGTTMGASRRGEYLRVVSTLLLSDLRSVRDAWAPGSSTSYRAEMRALASSDPRAALERILRGMGSLSGAELAGERMSVAYDTRDQEDEHSCFSDTTLQDQRYDAIGIRNVYLGRYVRADGTAVEGMSLSGLVRARDAALDQRMRSQLETSIAAIEAIPAPFDQAISGPDTGPGRAAVRAAISALEDQTRTIADIAALLGIRINFE